MMKYIITIMSLVLFSSSAYAQELKVKSMVMSTNDSSAKKYERMDLNDQPCALVKVKLSSPGAVFEGNVIPPTEFKQGEYWVYMTAGSQELRIKHIGFVPIHVMFTDFNIKRGVKSSATYTLTLQTPEENTDDGIRYLRLKVIPADSKVTIDGIMQIVNEEGVVSIQLTKGIHTYQVEADGYATKTGEVEMSDKSVTETVSLERTAPVQLYNDEGIPYETFKVGDVSFNMVRVDGGTFMMSTKEFEKKYGSYYRAHRVTLSTYYIGETEVTQELWCAVMGDTYQGSKNLPVGNVSWDDCQVFVQKLSQMTGRLFRLPTEAEWEFAARGGNKSRGYEYSGSNVYLEVVGNGLHEVKSDVYANELGLYDMSGNLWEWCSDVSAPHPKSAQTNPTGPADNPIHRERRIIRGGCYTNISEVVNRNDHSPTDRNEKLGFRLAMSM